MGYSREGDVVTVRMTADQYSSVIMALGIAAGQASKDSDDRGPFHFWLRLANAISDGNPEWRPYAVPEEART
jgi:hypothetical protein